jgi:hypothetical protein
VTWLHDDKSLCLKCNMYSFEPKPRDHQKHCPYYQPDPPSELESLRIEVNHYAKMVGNLETELSIAREEILRLKGLMKAPE